MEFDRNQERNGSEVRAQHDPESFGDGRDPLAKQATLLPSEEAVELGNRGEAAAFRFFSSMRHPLVESDLTSLGSELAYVADTYLREMLFNKLPATEDYRAYATRVGKAARTLLTELNAGRDKSWGINQGTRRVLKIDLWNNPRHHQPSVERTLRSLVSVCDEFASIQSQTGSRPREDIRIMVGCLAEIWERLTGSRCPTNLTRNRDKGDLDFEAEGPRFVHAVAQAFDPLVTPQQIATALRKRRAKKPPPQPSPTG